MTQKARTAIGDSIDEIEKEVVLVEKYFYEATANDKARISAIIRRLQSINAVEELRLQNLTNMLEYSGRSPVYLMGGSTNGVQ